MTGKKSTGNHEQRDEGARVLVIKAISMEFHRYRRVERA